MHSCCGFPSSGVYCSASKRIQTAIQHFYQNELNKAKPNCNILKVDASPCCASQRNNTVVENKCSCCCSCTNTKCSCSNCPMVAANGNNACAQSNCGCNCSGKKNYASDVESLNMLLKLQKYYPKIFFELLYGYCGKRLQNKTCRPTFNVSFRCKYKKGFQSSGGNRRPSTSKNATPKRSSTNFQKNNGSVKKKSQAQTTKLQTAHFENTFSDQRLPELKSNMAMSRSYLIGVQSRQRFANDDESKRKFLKEYSTARAKDVVIGEALNDLRKYYPKETTLINTTDKNIDNVIKSLDKKFPKDDILKNVKEEKFGDIIEPLKKKYPKDGKFINNADENVEGHWKNLKNKLPLESQGTDGDRYLEQLRKEFPNEKSLWNVTGGNLDKIVQQLAKKYPNKDILKNPEKMGFANVLNNLSSSGSGRNTAQSTGNTNDSTLEMLRKKYPNEKLLQNATPENMKSILENLKKKYPKDAAFLKEAETNAEKASNINNNSEMLEKLRKKFPNDKSLANASPSNIGAILENLKKKYPKEKSFIQEMNTKANQGQDENAQRLLDSLRKKYPGEQLLQNATPENMKSILEKLKKKYPKDAAYLKEAETNVDKDVKKAPNLNKNSEILERLRKKFPNDKSLANASLSNLGAILENLKKKYPKEKAFIEEMNTKANQLDENTQRLLESLRKKYPGEELLQNVTQQNIQSVLDSLKKKYPKDAKNISEVEKKIKTSLSQSRLNQERSTEKGVEKNLLDLELFDKKSFDYFLNLSIQPILNRLRKNFPNDRSLMDAITHNNIREVVQNLRENYPSSFQLLKDVERNIDRNLNSLKVAKDNSLDKCIASVLEELKRIFPQEKILNYANHRHIRDILALFKVKYPAFRAYLEDATRNIGKHLGDCNFAKYNPYNYNLNGNLQPLVDRLRKKFPNEEALYRVNNNNIESILEELSTKYDSDIYINYKPNRDVDDIFVNISKSEQMLNELAKQYPSRNVSTWEHILEARRKVVKLIKRRTGKSICQMLMNEPMDESLVYLLKDLLDDEIDGETKYYRRRKLRHLRRYLSDLTLCERQKKIPFAKMNFVKKQEHVPIVHEDRRNWKFQLADEKRKLEREKLKWRPNCNRNNKDNKWHYYYSQDNPKCLYLIADKEMSKNKKHARAHQKYDIEE